MSSMEVPVKKSVSASVPGGDEPTEIIETAHNGDSLSTDCEVRSSSIAAEAEEPEASATDHKATPPSNELYPLPENNEYCPKVDVGVISSDVQPNTFPLSPRYEIAFMVDSVQYFSVEHYLFCAISSEWNLSHDFSSLRSVKTFRDVLSHALDTGELHDGEYQNWCERHVNKLLKDAYRAQIDQISDVKNALLESGDQFLAYAVAEDGHLGIEMDCSQFNQWMSDNSHTAEHLRVWQNHPAIKPDEIGQNRVGEVLMQIRDGFAKKSTEQQKKTKQLETAVKASFNSENLAFGMMNISGASNIFSESFMETLFMNDGRFYASILHFVLAQVNREAAWQCQIRTKIVENWTEQFIAAPDTKAVRKLFRGFVQHLKKKQAETMSKFLNDEDNYLGHAKRFLREAYERKIEQSENFKRKLVQTGDNVLISANHNDLIFGLGVEFDVLCGHFSNGSIKSTEELIFLIQNPSQCSLFEMGSNLVGVVLTELREKLKTEGVSSQDPLLSEELDHPVEPSIIPNQSVNNVTENSVQLEEEDIRKVVDGGPNEEGKRSQPDDYSLDYIGGTLKRVPFKDYHCFFKNTTLSDFTEAVFTVSGFKFNSIVEYQWTCLLQYLNLYTDKLMGISKSVLFYSTAKKTLQDAINQGFVTNENVDEWYENELVGVLMKATRAKYSEHEAFYNQLMSTERNVLVFCHQRNNSLGIGMETDAFTHWVMVEGLNEAEVVNFWTNGVGRPAELGRNCLGLAYMTVREEIRRQNPDYFVEDLLPEVVPSPEDEKIVESPSLPEPELPKLSIDRTQKRITITKKTEPNLPSILSKKAEARKSQKISNSVGEMLKSAMLTQELSNCDASISTTPEPTNAIAEVEEKLDVAEPSNAKTEKETIVKQEVSKESMPTSKSVSVSRIRTAIVDKKTKKILIHKRSHASMEELKGKDATPLTKKPKKIIDQVEYISEFPVQSATSSPGQNEEPVEVVDKMEVEGKAIEKRMSALERLKSLKFGSTEKKVNPLSINFGSTVSVQSTTQRHTSSSHRRRKDAERRTDSPSSGLDLQAEDLNKMSLAEVKNAILVLRQQKLSAEGKLAFQEDRIRRLKRQKTNAEQQHQSFDRRFAGRGAARSTNRFNQRRNHPDPGHFRMIHPPNAYNPRPQIPTYGAPPGMGSWNDGVY